MKIVEGDIWTYFGTAWIVIPTNIGWKRDGCNVMGAGVAKQASILFPKLSKWYGELCQLKGEDSGVVRFRSILMGIENWKEGTLICFPVKPLNKEAPNLSWQSPASMDLLKESLEQLIYMCKNTPHVVLPLVGCGNGGLQEEDVLPLLQERLDDHYTLVKLPTFEAKKRWKKRSRQEAEIMERLIQPDNGLPMPPNKETE